MNVDAVVVEQQVVLQAELRLVQSPRMADHVCALGYSVIKGGKPCGHGYRVNSVWHAVELQDRRIQTWASRGILPPDSGHPESLGAAGRVQSSEEDHGLPVRQAFGNYVAVGYENAIWQIRVQAVAAHDEPGADPVLVDVLDLSHCSATAQSVAVPGKGLEPFVTEYPLQMLIGHGGGGSGTDFLPGDPDGAAV